MRYARVHGTPYRIIPSILTLAAIPIMIKPIDKMVDYIMDHTYRVYVTDDLHIKQVDTKKKK